MMNKSHFFLESVIYTKIAELGIETIEDPEVANKIRRASNNVHNIPYFLDNSVGLIARLISAFIAGLTLLTFFPELIPILMILAIPRMIVETRYLAKVWKLELDTTEENRKAYWNSDMISSSEPLAEVTTTGSFSFFNRAFKDYFKSYIARLKKIYDAWHSFGFILSLANTFIIFLSYFVILKRFIDGLITVGTFTFQIRAIDIFYGDFFWGVFEIFNMRQRAIRFKDTKELFDLTPSVKDGEIALEISQKPPLIEFKNVSFSYPRSDKKVLENFNLETKPGEKVAIVGKNGARKTTTVKLISRFYRATEGEILIDGTNINDLKAESWYKYLSIVSQEYNKYGHLTVRENILMGDINKTPDDEEMESAMKSADAHEFIQEYKNKYNQILSENLREEFVPQQVNGKK